MPVGARLVLSPRPDGTGEVHVDDRLHIYVTRQDGTTATYERGFEYLPPAAPLDLTSSVANGANTLRIRLMDTVGGGTRAHPFTWSSSRSSRIQRVVSGRAMFRPTSDLAERSSALTRMRSGG